MDQLAPLLSQTTLSAKVFHTGELCQFVDFDTSQNMGHVHLMKAGKLKLFVRGKEFGIIKEPSILFFPRPCHHSFEPIESSECDLLCAFVDLGVKVRSPLAVALPEVLIIPMSAVQSLAPTLDLMFKEAFEQEFGRQTALDTLVEYFMVLVLRYVLSKGQLKEGIFAALADPRLANAVNVMHEKPSHPWTLEELADQAGMSRARFAVNFRETVGTTPLEYLTDWRMSVVQNLLKQGKSIKSIAAASGYQNQASLSRVFIKKIGCSPTDWLKSA